MTMFSIILSFMLGSCIGIAYALSFLHNNRRMISAMNDELSQPYRNKIFKFIFSITRLVILSIIWLYIIRMPSVNFGVTMLSFFIAFWIIIIKRKSTLIDV